MLCHIIQTADVTIKLSILTHAHCNSSLLLFSSGQRGVYTTSSGLQIAYLSGYYDKSKYMTSNDNNEIVSIINMYMYCMYISETWGEAL